MHRFFVPPNLIQAKTASLPPEASRQAALVLRLKPGDQVVLLDDTGWEYLAALTDVSTRLTTGQIIEKRFCQAEPAAQVWLYQALTSREKFEWILQKATELGMAGITPVICTRSLAREIDSSKQLRWQRILQEAAEQCGRGRIPVLSSAQPLQTALKTGCKEVNLCLFAWEEEDSTSLATILAHTPAVKAAAVFIGPEGGYTREEADAAKLSGARVVSLGKRILRTETAALASLALIMQSLGELG